LTSRLVLALVDTRLHIACGDCSGAGGARAALDERRV
jgi:hypothetical protein